ELGRGADVGVVGADHHDRVAPGGEPAVPVDDLAERPVGVAVHVVVGDAGAHLVGQVDAEPGEHGGDEAVRPPGAHHGGNTPTLPTLRDSASTMPRATTPLLLPASLAATYTARVMPQLS